MDIIAMIFLKKIKINYQFKLFNDYLINNDFESAYQYVLDLSKKNKIDFFIFLKNIQNQLSQLSSDLFKKKIIWILSYDANDRSYLNEFLNYYLKKNANFNFKINNFTNILNEHLTNLNLKEQKNIINFDDFKAHSYLYQSLILFNSKEDILFLNSSAAFFETNMKKYFIYPNNTFCYFYIDRKPEDLYKKYKEVHGTSEGAYDELLNLNQKEYLPPNQNDLKYEIYENRTNINTHFKSWSDSNVISTFKGKLIDYSRFDNDKESVLLEILYHLKQYGLDINIHPEDIKGFVLSNQNNDLSNANPLSKSEQKFLKKNIDRYNPII